MLAIELFHHPGKGNHVDVVSAIGKGILLYLYKIIFHGGERFFEPHGLVTIVESAVGDVFVMERPHYRFVDSVKECLIVQEVFYPV